MHTQIQAPATRALRASEKLATAMYAGEMPRERLARLGPQGLKDEELLAVALGTGYKGRHVRELATEILADAVVETLIAMELDQLSRIKGLGKAKAGVLVAAFELARRGLHQGLGARPVVRSPADVLPLLVDIRDQRREHFLCLYLNARNQVIHKEVVSIGSLACLRRSCIRAKFSSRRWRSRQLVWFWRTTIPRVMSCRARTISN